MTGSVTLYTKALVKTASGQINWGAGAVIRAVLVTASYSPAGDVDSTWSNVSAYETSGTGYTAGGIVVTSPAVTQGSGANSNVVLATGSFPGWTGVTANAKYLVLVSSTNAGLQATDPLLAYVDLNPGNGNIPFVAGTLTIDPYEVDFTHSP